MLPNVAKSGLRPFEGSLRDLAGRRSGGREGEEKGTLISSQGTLLSGHFKERNARQRRLPAANLHFLDLKCALFRFLDLKWSKVVISGQSRPHRVLLWTVWPHIVLIWSSGGLIQDFNS